MDPWFRNRLNSRILVFRIIWFAMVSSIFIYAFIMSLQPATAQSDWVKLQQNTPALIFTVMAILAFVASLLVPGKVLNASIMAMRSRPWTEEALRSAVNSRGMRLYRDVDIAKLVTLQGEDLMLERMFGPYSISKIVRWALLDAVAAFGFVMANTEHSLQTYYPFAALALFGMLSSLPSESELRALAKSQPH